MGPPLALGERDGVVEVHTVAENEGLLEADGVKWEGVVDGEREGVLELHPVWVPRGGDTVGPPLPIEEREGVVEELTEADMEALLEVDGVNWEAVVEGESEGVGEPPPELLALTEGEADGDAEKDGPSEALNAPLKVA